MPGRGRIQGTPELRAKVGAGGRSCACAVLGGSGELRGEASKLVWEGRGHPHSVPGELSSVVAGGGQ